MSELLIGPFGELYELSTRFDATGGAASTMTLRDAESWRRTLDWVADHPANLGALRKTLMRAVPSLGAELWGLTERRLLELLAREVASGEIIIVPRARDRPAVELLDSVPADLTALAQEAQGDGDSPPPEPEPTPVPVVECILAVVTYECQHKADRKAALRLEVGTSQASRVLEVVAADKGNGDTITVKPEYSAALCGAHQPKALVASGTGLREIRAHGDFDVEVFYSRVDTNNLLRYFWPWNLAPAEFTLAPQACTGHGVGATIRVYPALSVEAKLKLDLDADERFDDKLELAKKEGRHEKRGRPAHTGWKLGIEGKVKYASHSLALSAEFCDGKIRKWASFNLLIKRAIDTFVDKFFKFTHVEIRPLFPKLEIEYKGQYSEIEGKTTVGTEWSVLFKADPLIGIQVRVEMLALFIEALSNTPQTIAIGRGLAKIREWAASKGQKFEVYLGLQGLIAGKLGAKKKPEMAHADLSGTIHGAIKAIFEAKASFGSAGWLDFKFEAECKGNTGIAVCLELGHDNKGVFLAGKFVLLECKFEYGAWASGKFIWELKEGYEGEYVLWKEQDLLKTGNKYVLSNG